MALFSNQRIAPLVMAQIEIWENFLTVVRHPLRKEVDLPRSASSTVHIRAVLKRMVSRGMVTTRRGLTTRFRADGSAHQALGGEPLALALRNRSYPLPARENEMKDLVKHSADTPNTEAARSEGKSAKRL